MRKKYTHPLEDTTFDVYPLHERNKITNIVAAGVGEGFNEQVIGKPKTAGFSGHGKKKEEASARPPISTPILNLSRSEAKGLCESICVCEAEREEMKREADSM